MSTHPPRRQGHGVKLSFYDFGATPFFASQFDQRFSYCLYAVSYTHLTLPTTPYV